MVFLDFTRRPRCPACLSRVRRVCQRSFMDLVPILLPSMLRPPLEMVKVETIPCMQFYTKAASVNPHRRLPGKSLHTLILFPLLST